MKKRNLIIGCAVVVVLAVLIWVFVTILHKPQPLTIATYGLTESEVICIKTLIGEMPESETKVVYTELSTDKPLDVQIKSDKNIDLVFAENGLAFEKAKTLFAPLDENFFTKLPSVFTTAENLFLRSVFPDKLVDENTDADRSTKAAGQGSFFPLSRKISYRYALPLNYNILSFYLDLHIYPHAKMNVYSADELQALFEQGIQSAQYATSLVGADDTTLMLLLSNLLIEYRIDYSSDEIKQLQETVDFHKVLPVPLKSAMDRLIAWKNAGFLHSQYADLVDRDVQTFLEFNQAASAFLTTAQRIELDRDFMSEFRPIDIVLANKLAQAQIPARLLLLSQIDKKQTEKKHELIQNLLEYFAADTTQRSLADTLHFSAVEYSANTTQPLSSAAGFVYSAESIIPTVDQALFDNAGQRQKFITAVRRYLAANGVGYGER